MKDLSINTTTETNGATISLQVLSDLWRIRLDTMITAIANNEHHYKEIANAAEHISTEYYGRFLIELIQNANDQAIRGETTGCVTIIRTKDIIAVGNVGEPFDKTKVNEITSIFLSNKSVSECVGNKGVGFKAVFQIADSAEIYSAKPFTSLEDGLNLGFQIVRHPFNCELFRQTLSSIVDELLDRQPDRYKAIEDRFNTTNVCEAVLKEAEEAAWFKFPLEANSEQFSDRLRQLGENASSISECQTIIILPVDPNDDEVQELVEHAIDEIVGNEDDNDSLSGAPLLFLSGLDRLDIVDQVRDFSAQIVREPPELSDTVDNDVEVQRISIQTVVSKPISVGKLSSKSSTQQWWVARTLIGSNEEEQAALRQAIDELRLPPENWKDVSTAPVSIALPCNQISLDRESDLASLPATGRFCIGLPTKMDTGSPLWVNAPFHGTIARTDIRLKNHYNQLLFEKAISLAGHLVTRFKRDKSLHVRRLVTLLMRKGNGPVSERFYDADGLAKSAVVLAEDGSFLTGTELAMPASDDVLMYLQLVDNLDGSEEFGFVLPDRVLLLNARNVLDELCPQGSVSSESYLTQGTMGGSILERAAKLQRGGGEKFWQPFLDWILLKQWPDIDALREQRIIPVGTSGLERASSRIFFRPFTSESADEDAEAQIDSDDELELRELDESVAELLKFFDDNALPVRLPDSRKYTATASKLAIDHRSGLINRPRLEDLLNQAVIPALQDVSEDNDKSLRLLNQAILWLNQMEPKSLARVRTDKLLVPAYDRSKRAWKWVSPAHAYLGEDWEDGKSNQLLTSLYHHRPGAQLVPWPLFEKKARSLFGGVSRQDWVAVMRSLGVCNSPRVISIGRKVPVLLSHGYGPPLSLNPGVAPPSECGELVWKSYLQRIRNRSSYNKTVAGSNKFYLSDALWIDGLEDAANRSTVVEAVLRSAANYSDYFRVQLSRRSGENSTDSPALWLHALQQMDWAVFPTSHGLKTSHDSWWLPSSDRRKRQFQFMSTVPSEYAKAKVFLDEVEIRSLDESPVIRLIDALHDIAVQLPKCKPDDLRYVRALATDVYVLLDQRLKDTVSENEFSEVLSAPVPLVSTNGIAATDLSEVGCIYLNDDAIRAEHVAMPESRWMIPTRFEYRYSALIRALSNVLGDDKIVRVSNEVMTVQFEPTSAAVPLVDYLRTEFPNKPILEDIALLIVQGGGRSLDSRGQRFERRWNRFCETSLVFGTFSDDDTRTCFDRHAKGGPTLRVNRTATRYDVVSCSWQIVNKACEDTWVLYAVALGRGEESKFLAGKGVAEHERMEIESVIGMGFEQRLDQFTAACLAVWRKGNPTISFDEFQSSWKLNTKSPESTGDWLDISEVGTLIDQASRVEEPQGSLLILRSKDVSVSDWQDARRELGEDPFVFATSVSAYELVKSVLTSRVMALVAHLAVPAASSKSPSSLTLDTIADAKSWIEAIASQSVPNAIRHCNASEQQVISQVVEDGLTLQESVGIEEKLPAVVSALWNLLDNPPSSIGLIELKREPTRSALVYQHDVVEDRSTQSKTDVRVVLKVTIALASHFGEELCETAIQSNELVELFSGGWWSNRISVLAALRYAIEVQAPKTADRMKSQRAFRDVDDWQSLWRKFSELGDPPRPETPPAAKPKFNLLGHAMTEDDFLREASSGSDGLIAKAVAAAVVQDLDLAGLRDRSRSQVGPLIHPKPKRKRGVGGSKAPKSENELKILGAIGERYVYQQFRVILPNFDAHNWKSGSREQFDYSAGDDRLGYDFEYRDSYGKLTGRDDLPMCRIEVKATTGDGTNAFDMSTNEWDVAYECHNNDEAEVYIVVRVASVAQQPTIADVLVDPVDLRQQGVLDYSSRNLLVVVGESIES